MARKILLADDSVTAQNMGRKILADAGYEVITVNNGSAALKKIAELKPDLIVLDVYMPGYSGLEVCQRVKETGDTSRIPILLTVGKLEPFKPEEAKRVRADGYIVKPFEASELLSALSKLEDKVVPRSEGSKPGRFARAAAAIEEGRYDKSVAAEEDSGWKSRIVFPKKKEEKPPEPDVDEAAMYNPVNKDLRTVVDHGQALQKPESGDERVDLGALAPEGFPKDVTPEEIAALAAAAAQVKGAVAEHKRDEPVAEMAVTAPAEDAKPEAKDQGPSVESVPPTVAELVAAEPKTDETDTKPEPETVATPAAVMATILELEQQAITSNSTSGNGSSSHGAVADEPVTMAVAGSQSTRWTAVAVALAADEAGISLEQEMQKTYAAFAAAESGHSQAAPAVDEAATVNTTEIQASATATDVALPMPAETVPAESAEQIASPISEAGNAATEAFSAPMPESVTTNAAEEPSAPAEPEPVQAKESAVEVSRDAEPVKLASDEPAISEPPNAVEEPVREWLEEKDQEAAHQAQIKEESAASPAASTVVTNDSESSAAMKEEVAEVTASDSGSPKAGGTEEMAKKESDIAANTAAAWASWRKIRETKDSKPGIESEKDASEPQDSAAMAVAVGAESSPEDVNANLDADPEIASIVDSVLADMRPRIVEEIARKLGKKK